MAAFVNDDEVELRADADARPVAAEVTVLEAVAVSHGALVFHAGVRRFDQLVAVLLKRVFTEIVLVSLDHALGLGELLLGLGEVLGQSVEVHRQVAEAVFEMDVVADVQRDAVVVDRVLHQPVPARVAVAEVGLADELAVGDVHQVVRDRDADLHRLDFVFPLIFVRPPDARAFAFAGREDPIPAGRIFTKSESAETADRLRRARVVEIYGVNAAGFQRLRKINKDSAGVTFILERDR